MIFPTPLRAPYGQFARILHRLIWMSMPPGQAMMEAAKAACSGNTKLLAVTILTSLNAEALQKIGYGSDVAQQVQKMALLTRESGLDGVVCSSHEIELLRAACGSDFTLMVPGIRPEGADKGDQKRVMTPLQAVQAGATHLVIGRPVTGSPDPARAAQDILDQL
ncbi:MAG: orotidine-5'-phosphate decarboxylase [Alphaproteobacteria bacterium]